MRRPSTIVQTNPAIPALTGASLLWAGTPREERPFYDLKITPGDQRVRRKTDTLIRAQLLGYQSDNVRLYARFNGTTKWEMTAMQPAGGAFEFLFAGLPESMEYYVEAGALRSKTYKITTRYKISAFATTSPSTKRSRR